METHHQEITDKLRRLEAEVRQLRGIVDDLAADSRQVHDRLAEVVSAVGGSQGRDDASRPDSDPLAAALGPEYARAQGAPRPLPIRAVKWVLRGTLGLLRRAWQASDPALDAQTKLRLELQGEVGSLPRVGVLTTTSALGHEAASGPAAALGEQTDASYQLAAWDPEGGTYHVHGPSGERIASGTARSAQELVAALGWDHVIDAAGLPPHLEPTFVESLRWLLASEDLQVVLFTDRGARPLAVVAAGLWRTGGGVDLEALARRARRVAPAILAKIVADSAAGAMLPAWDPLGPGSSELVRQAGRHLVSRGAPRDRVVGRFKTLGGSPAPCPDAGGRRTVLVLLSSPPVGGLEDRLGVLLRDLADEFRFVVAIMDPAGPLGSARVAALHELTPHVYPLGTWFEPELWPSLLAHLAARFEASSLLHVGSGPGAAALVNGLRERVPDLWIVHQPDPGWSGGHDLRPSPGVDLHLAVTAAAERALQAHGCAPERVLAIAPEVVAGPVVTGDAGSADRAQLRDQLGLPEAATAVVMVADLLPEKRPEDYVALARRLRDEEGVFFLLVGDGPLAATVRDLTRIFALQRFALRPPSESMAEVVAAADLVCSTSESEPTPTWLLAAMTAGRPVVACAVDDVASLLERYGDGRSTTVPVADVEAMERALRATSVGPASADKVPQIEAEQERALAAWRQALGPRPRPGS